jgi:uncharacterized protein (DUF3820 family)
MIIPSSSKDNLMSANDENAETPVVYDHADFLKLAKAKMPFGKYAGYLLIDLPEPYVVWFSQKGFPPGELGQMLQAVYEIKVNGLEYLFEPLKDI